MSARAHDAYRVADLTDLARRGARPAVVSDDGPETTITTWAQLAVAAAEVAAGLRARGYGPGDRVASILPSGAPFLALALGTLAAGATFVPLHPTWWPRELEATVELAGPGLVVADASVAANTLAAISHLAPVAHLPPGKVVRSALEGNSTDGLGSTGGLGSDVDDPTAVLVALRQHASDGRVPFVGDGAGLVLPTTGAVGEPRLCVFTDEQLRRHWIAPLRLRVGGRPTPAALTVWTPMAHAATLRLTLSALLGATTVITLPRWTAARGVQCLARHRTDVLWATTPQLLATAHRARAKRSAPHERPSTEGTVTGCVLASGGLVGPARRLRLEADFGVPVHAIYTATEAGGLVTALPRTSSDPGHEGGTGTAPTAPVSGLPIGPTADGVLIALAGPDGRPISEAGAVGRVHVAGPAAAVDVLGAPARSPLGWSLADLAALDGGIVQLAGRATDRFVCDGTSVDAALMELALAGDERLADVAVIPRPEPDGGAIAVAVTVPEHAERPPFLHELLQAPQEVSALRPRAQWVVDKLPLTVAGQLHRRLLAAEESSR